VVEKSLDAVELAVLPERPLSGRPTNGSPNFPVIGGCVVYILLFIFTCLLPISFASIAISATIEQPSKIAWTLMGVAIIIPIAIHCLVRRYTETDMDKRLDQFDGDAKVVNEDEIESCLGSNGMDDGMDDESEVSDGLCSATGRTQSCSSLSLV
jgi:hypothetical protein